MPNETPMMKAYRDAKREAGDAILLFRMGDFYELFGDDAKVGHDVLGLTLTSREKGDNALAMAGFPYHQLDAYVAKLIGEGHQVAVCDQVGSAPKGLPITRIVGGGDLLSEQA